MQRVSSAEMIMENPRELTVPEPEGLRAETTALGRGLLEHLKSNSNNGISSKAGPYSQADGRFDEVSS